MILLAFMLFVAMTTSAQEFSTRTPGEQWMDSVCQTVRLTPIVFAHEVPLIVDDHLPMRCRSSWTTIHRA